MSILLLLAIFFTKTMSRTCQCVYLTEQSCVVEMNPDEDSERCIWHPTPKGTYGDTQGSTGICRTTKWLCCHNRFDMDTDARCEEARKMGCEAAKVSELLEIPKRRLETDNSNNRHWPFCCNVESDSPPDCGDNIGTVVEGSSILAHEKKIHTARVGNGDSFLGLSMIGKLMAFVTFAALIGFVTCYKYTQSLAKYGKLTDVSERPTSYATFEA